MDKVLRIILVEEDLNDAEMMISAIKAGGYAVRPTRTADEAGLGEALKSHAPDLVLCSLDADIDLEQAVTCVRHAGKHLPVLAVAANGSGEAAACMQQGAVDLVYKGCPEHLKLVVHRTAEAQRQWTTLKRLEGALHESEKRCRTLLDSSRDSICYVHEGMHIYANRPYLELFGYAELDDIEGTPVMDMVAPSHQQTMKELLRNLDKAAKENQSLELDLRHANGETFDARMELSPASIEGEACVQIVIRERANAQALERQLSHLSQRDPATGLYNRKHFMEELKSAAQRAAQGEQNSALIQINLDNSAAIKEAVGVAAVDLVIAEVARILDKAARAGDVVARFTESTFTILTSQWERSELEARGRDLAGSVDQHPCEVEGKSVVVAAAIGAAQIDENAPNVDELLSRCERACQQASEARSAGLVVYVPAQDEMTQRQLDASWSQRLDEALESDRVQLLYQPIVSLHGDPGERYELYMRLLDTGGEDVPAAEFLASAERTGMARSLDRWVIANALKRLAQARQKNSNTVFFLKLSAGSVQDPELLSWIGNRLRECRVPPSSLVFAIKEPIVVNYLKQARQVAKGLHEMHCQVALDDFGTALNPFQLLKSIHADYLKVDKSLMQAIHTNTENQEAMRTITDTAHAMDKVTIAQHVEEAAALSVLWGMGVNYIQGNFLKPPSPQLDYDFSTTE